MGTFPAEPPAEPDLAPAGREGPTGRPAGQCAQMAEKMENAQDKGNLEGRPPLPCPGLCPLDPEPGVPLERD